MKTKLHLLILITLIIVSCKRDLNNTSVIACIIDRSDPYIIAPNYNNLVELGEKNSDIWQGQQIILTTIGELDQDTIITISLSEQNHFFHSQKARRLKIATFNDILRKSYNSVTNFGENTRSNSNILRTLIFIANSMVKIDGKNKTVVLASDCEENDLISTYDEKTFDLIKNNPILIKQIIYKELKIENYQSISFNIFYKAPNRKAAIRFRALSQFFKSILEEHHAKSVNIGYSLKTN